MSDHAYKGLIPRRMMSLTEPILLIIIGCVSVCFIVGFVFLIWGIKKLKAYSENNRAGEYCLAFDETADELLAISSDGRQNRFSAIIERNLYYSPNDGRLYLTVPGVFAEKLDLGYCVYAEYQKFISSKI